MKTKKIKELENEISELKKELSEVKELNQFLAHYFNKEDCFPVMFDNTCRLTISGYHSGTAITYLYEEKIHTLETRYLGAPYDIKILRNTKNHCIFECSDKSKHILNKAKEVISQLPDDTIFLKDFEIDNSAIVKIQVEDGIFTVGCIKEK